MRILIRSRRAEACNSFEPHANAHVAPAKPHNGPGVIDRQGSGVGLPHILSKSTNSTHQPGQH